MTPNLIDYSTLFYHFTKIETAVFHILPRLQLKLSPFLSSNDPKETQTFGYWSIYEDCSDAERVNIEAAFKNYLKVNLKQLCFSDNYIVRHNKTNWQNCGAIHPTMWSHYANNSRGICLGIDKKQFLIDNPSLIAKKVKYVKLLKYPRLDYQKWQIEKDVYFKKFVLENSKTLLFQKHFHWKSEDETKCIEIGQRDYCTIRNSLKFVFVGSEHNPDVNLVLKTIIPNHVHVEKINIEDGRLRTLPFYLNNN